MEWNLKIPCWDFAEFEQGTIANIDGVSGSGSFGEQGIKGDFSVDLKLGQVIDSGSELGDNLQVPSVSKMTLSPSGSLKRARALNNSIQTANCLVDGCNADLSNCREYHRRHKVCEVHSKTPQVSVNGQKQRFCQQCSRFHSLEEFDEGKRSCRKRLDGHNRRRRKAQPELLSRVGSLFSSQQGSTMLQFSNPQVYQTTAVTNPIWAGVVKAEEDAKYYNRHPHSNSQKQNPFPKSSSSSDKLSPGKQFSLFHSSTNLKLNNHTLFPKTACQQQPLLTFASSETSSSNDKVFCVGFPDPARVVHPDCALSLLSSSPSQTSCTSLSHVNVMQQPNLFSTANPSDHSGLNYSSLELMMVPNGSGSDAADVHCQQGMVRMGTRDNETPQTLPFYWE